MTARGAIGRPARAEQPAAGRSAAGQAADIDHDDLEPGAIVIRLDEVLAERGMTLTELSERVGITVVNLSVLKNGRARAIRFSTLAGLCAVLGCQPGDLLRYQQSGSYEPGSASG